jgi:hypothetical protein
MTISASARCPYLQHSGPSLHLSRPIAPIDNPSTHAPLDKIAAGRVLACCFVLAELLRGRFAALRELV